MQPDKAGPAFADEALQLVDARRPVLAGIGGAIVDAVLTLLASETGLAGARVVVYLIDTLTVVSTGSGRAFVDIGLAGRAGPARIADALVTEELVHADSVQARIARTQIDLFVAAFAREPWRAVAGEVVDQIGTVGTE